MKYIRWSCTWFLAYKTDLTIVTFLPKIQAFRNEQRRGRTLSIHMRPDGQEPVNWLHYKPGYDTWQCRLLLVSLVCSGPSNRPRFHSTRFLMIPISIEEILIEHNQSIELNADTRIECMRRRIAQEYRPHCDGGCGMDPVQSGMRVASSLCLGRDDLEVRVFALGYQPIDGHSDVEASGQQKGTP